MVTDKRIEDEDFEVRIGLPEGKEWSADHLAYVKAFIKKENEKRTPEQKRNTSLVAIRYRMEAYVDKYAPGPDKFYTVEQFLGDYLKVLNCTFKKFAASIDTTDGNLKKYLSGERKFNTDLAMKFGCFFHTSPELWINVNTRNELLLLKKEKSHMSRYKKYDYKKILHFEEA